MLIQDICPLVLIEHSQELFNEAQYDVFVAAMKSPTGQFEQSDRASVVCSAGFPPPLPLDDRLKTPTIIAQAAIHVIAGPRVPCEPELPAYAKPYAPGPQLCNPLAAIGSSIQTPPQFQTYDQFVYAFLTSST